jgi:hypothetical protein
MRCEYFYYPFGVHHFFDSNHANPIDGVIQPGRILETPTHV